METARQRPSQTMGFKDSRKQRNRSQAAGCNAHYWRSARENGPRACRLKVRGHFYFDLLCIPYFRTAASHWENFLKVDTGGDLAGAATGEVRAAGAGDLAEAGLGDVKIGIGQIGVVKDVCEGALNAQTDLLSDGEDF